jgi:hypothetical protein
MAVKTMRELHNVKHNDDSCVWDITLESGPQHSQRCEWSWRWGGSQGVTPHIM